MGTTRRLNLDISEEAADLVRDRVKKGEYVSEGAVIEAALHLLRERDDELALRLDEIRRRVRRSLEDEKPAVSADDAERQLTQFMECHTRPAS
ncbi:hypothetical protein [Rhizobium oryzicola]|uniref:Type II toxin-antitoxin system ParD family antitoxin n=1 Tax=Rhizobium oryzicola TaxID=1232668 RepID=A0ABT8SSS7_9HYPH|nr:hypothetical protein [Rhizobium oryzicola]MDO1581470.1 hypothetical protein [Rhizobium oryzicola]